MSLAKDRTPERRGTRMGPLDLGDVRKSVLAVYAALALLIVFTLIVRPNLTSQGSLTTIVVFASVTALVGLGQGAVIFMGGIDLSLPSTMTASAIIFAGITRGDGDLLIPGLGVALALALIVGVFNGVGVTAFGIHPVIMTLAMGAIVGGATLGYTGGSVTGAPPASVRDFMTAPVLGLPAAIWLLILLTILVTIGARTTTLGRRIQAVGMNKVAARLGGVHTGRLEMSTYIVSAVCAAVAGVMLSGLASQSYLGMGEPYLLSSIAVVALGGASFSGGRGHFLGTVGAALLLSLLTSLLTTFQLPEAVRQIVLGAVILLAVIAGGVLRRRAQ
ncbi:ABC transporter permease [Microbacterium testaceum]|uniref:ABC transporter permease n=1 Tax=Microbacterium testaceum TaxID=2033 RepID=UPI0012489799|nr:ABC transporter permease [Microbacterium testaceum]